MGFLSRRERAIEVDEPLIEAVEEERKVDFGDLEIIVMHARWMPAWFWQVKHKSVFVRTPVAQGYTVSEKIAYDAAQAVCALISGRAPAPEIIDRGYGLRGGR